MGDLGCMVFAQENEESSEICSAHACLHGRQALGVENTLFCSFCFFVKNCNRNQHESTSEQYCVVKRLDFAEEREKC
jgi:hypothetical protein